MIILPQRIMICSPYPAFSFIRAMYFVIPITVISAVIALIGNSFVLLVIVKREYLWSQPAYQFIASLASADILVSSLAQPLYITLLFKGDCWLKRISHFVGSLASSASALGLLIVSIDRLIFITKPLHYYMIVKPARVYIALVYIWFNAVAISLLPYVAGIRNFHIVVLSATVINFITIGYCYATIYRIVSHRVNADLTRNQSRSRRQRQATWTIAFVILAMVICWLPYIITSFVWSLDVARWSPDSYIISVYFWLLALGHWNSSVNVLIYSWKNRELRSAILLFLGIKLANQNSLSISNNANDQNPGLSRKLKATNDEQLIVDSLV